MNTLNHIRNPSFTFEGLKKYINHNFVMNELVSLKILPKKKMKNKFHPIPFLIIEPHLHSSNYFIR